MHDIPLSRSQPAFLPLSAGKLFSVYDNGLPSELTAWESADQGSNRPETHFGFVFSGTANLTSESGSFVLREGMYFSVAGPFSIRGGSGLFIMTPPTFRGFFMLGGPVEDRGRLRYIDGCTDSLLISPIRLGDPCLNLLHLPPGADQSAHTHPSHRLGVVFRGRGECVTTDSVREITAGEVFCIPAECIHRFRTSSEAMLVLAYHPDSDTGPTDEDHPMVNRTILGPTAESRGP